MSENNHIIKQGYQHKQGGFIQSWKKRYFAIVGSDMLYFEDQNTAQAGNFRLSASKKQIPLFGSQITLYDANAFKRDYTFGILPAGQKRVYIITASSYSDMHDWISALFSVGCVYATKSRSLNEMSDNNVELVSAFSTKEGFMLKTGENSLFKRLKRRYFVLESDTISYFRDKTLEHIAQPQRTVDLRGGVAVVLDQEACADMHKLIAPGTASTDCRNVIEFQTRTDYGRVFTFVAQNEEEAFAWRDAINLAIKNIEVRLNQQLSGGSGSTNRDNDSESSRVGRTSSMRQSTRGSSSAAVAGFNSSSNSKQLSSLTLQLYMRFCQKVAGEYSSLHVNQENHPEFKNLNSELSNMGVSAANQVKIGGNAFSTNPMQPALQDVSVFSSTGTSTNGWQLRLTDGEWRQRWCSINSSTRTLRYWASPNCSRSQLKPLKTISLVDAEIALVEQPECRITGPGSIFVVMPAGTGKKSSPIYFAAPSTMLIDKWLTKLAQEGYESMSTGTIPSKRAPRPTTNTGNNNSDKEQQRQQHQQRQQQQQQRQQQNESPTSSDEESEEEPSFQCNVSGNLTDAERVAAAEELIRTWKSSCKHHIVPMLISLHVILPQAPSFPDLQDMLDQGTDSDDFDFQLVKKAYIAAAKVVHPDKMGHGLVGEKIIAEELFSALQSAFSVFRQNKGT